MSKKIDPAKVIAAYEEHIEEHGFIEDAMRDWMNLMAKLSVGEICANAEQIKRISQRFASVLNKVAP